MGFEKQVLHELLRDRGAALHDVACRHVLECGARDADDIEPDVVAEPTVFDRDKGVRHVARKIL